MTNEPRILHIAHGIPSYNNSLIQMAQLFSHNGLELCVASHVDLSAVLQETDAKVVQLTADVLITNERRQKHMEIGRSYKPFQILRRIRANREYRRRFLESLELDELVETWQPSLLLIDLECHVAIIRLSGKAVKTVLCSRWFTVFKTGNVPPMHTDLQPENSVIQRLKIRIAWGRLRMKRLRMDLSWRLSRRRFWPVTYGSNCRFDLESVASQRGLSLRQFTDRSHWLIPHVYSNLPIMSMTAVELEFGDELDHRMHYVGPMVGCENSRHALYASGVQQFERFLSRDKRSNTSRLVYCSFSTFWSTAEENIRVLLSLFNRRQDLDLVIGLGGNSIPDYLTDLPSNILALEFAPQLKIMHIADVVITHGGISTINESLYHGVPLLVCSSGHVDQDGCLARVVYHGVGLAASSAPLSDTEIESLLNILLGEEGHNIRRNVIEVQGRMVDYEAQKTMINYAKSAMTC